MKKAIVTGANGFIGSAVVKELLRCGVEVIALGREGHKDNIPKEARFVNYELSESATLSERIPDRDVDVFYHFAWEGSAGQARGNTKLQLNNVQWTIDCIRAAKEMNCRRFVGAGSIMEREAMAAVYEQGNRPGMGCVYGSAKAQAHMMSAPVASDLGIDFIWGEITNAYGVGEISPRFINSVLRKIIEKEPLQFTPGTQNYDFVYIDDVARAFRMIGEKGKPFCSYTIGSSNAKPLKEFILEIKKVLAPEREFVFGAVPFLGVNLPLDFYDCSITEQHTGFRAEVSFEEGIKRTMEWMEEQLHAEF